MDVESRILELLSSTPVVPNYEAKFSRHGRNLVHQAMRVEASKANKSSNPVMLHLGQPNKSLAPFTGIKLQMTNGEEVALDKQHIEDLALYGPGLGLPEFKKWLWDIQLSEHKPPAMTMENHPSGFDVCVTNGITPGLTSVQGAFLNTDGTDVILMENISYASVIANLKTHGMDILGLDYDDEGIVPSVLEDTMKNWTQHNPGMRQPSLLYTITTSHNPTGYSWSLRRMVDIYMICRKYDLLIIDDGAYYFLQFGERARSFQSFDIDGRVIRFDTFSKILGAGYRMGWISGPKVIVDKVAISNEITCVHPSTLTQATVYAMLQHWGVDGFQKRTREVSTFYKQRCECISNACSEYLTGIATWTVPKGGMFIWITINDIEDSTPVTQELEKNNFFGCPGRIFRAQPGVSNAIRFCYSLAAEEDMVKAIECLGKSIHKVKATK